MKIKGLISIGLLLPLSLMAGDSITVHKRIVYEYVKDISRGSIAWDNPSLSTIYRPYNTWSTSVLWEHKNMADAYITALGDETRNLIFSVEGKSKISTNTVYQGSIAYSRLWQKGVRFNDVLDYNIVYPYLVGDAIGGKMDDEAYKFSSFFTHILGRRWMLSEGIDYRAEMSVRKVDPRPKNTTSDFHAFISSAYIWRKNILAMGMDLTIYDQESNIKYLSNSSPATLFQFMGLGVTHPRFDGGQRLVDYKGSGVKIMLDYLGESKKWTYGISTHFTSLGLGKELGLKSNLELNRLSINTIICDMHLIYNMPHWTIGGRLKAKASERVGQENIIGASEGNYLPIIGNVKAYKQRETEIGLSIPSLYTSKLWTAELTPHISFTKYEEKHLPTKSLIENNFLTTSVKSSVSRLFKCWLVEGEIRAGYMRNYNNMTILNVDNGEDIIKESTLKDAKLMSADRSKMEFKLLTSYAITPKYSIMLSLNAKYINYKQIGSQKCYELTLGLRI